jgi:hypothetical protein
MFEVLQGPIDSLATGIGSDIGQSVALLIITGLGAVNKFVVSWVMKPFNLKDKLPPWGKSAVAFVFAQLAVLANGKIASLGIPTLPVDINMMSPWITGSLVWVSSMGWHDFFKKIITPLLTKTQ